MRFSIDIKGDFFPGDPARSRETAEGLLVSLAVNAATFLFCPDNSQPVLMAGKV